MSRAWKQLQEKAKDIKALCELVEARSEEGREGERERLVEGGRDRVKYD